MRKSLVFATFAVASAGALGLGATVTLNGSDTLGDMTHDFVVGNPHFGGTAQCPVINAGYSAANQINYLGGGSGKGEQQMSTGAQIVAPMSRPLDPGTSKDPCHTTGLQDGGASTANGIVVALDGVSLVTSQANGGSSACNGLASETSCNNAANLSLGLAFNTTVSAATRGGGNPAYTFQSWQDVLKVLYFGKVDSAFHPTDPEVGTNCGSTIRAAIANNFGTIFENGCGGAACTQLEHLFRRDDASGTTDIFSALLGFSGPSAVKNPVSANVGTWGLGSDNFCNDLGETGGTEWSGSNLGLPGDNGVVAFDHQDYDPIRRACPGSGKNLTSGNQTAQVCERATYNAGTQTWTAGTLGLVLAAVDNTAAPDELGTSTTAVHSQYNTLGTATGTPTTVGLHVNRCAGKFGFATAPSELKSNGLAAVAGFCPNGDLANSGQCLVPVDGNGNPNCLSTNSDVKAPAVKCTTQGSKASNFTVCDTTPAGAFNPANADPRAFNLYSWHWTGTAWVQNVDNSGRPISGAYYRIHTNQSMLDPNSAGVDPGAPSATPFPQCNYLDMTDQIGCLVQASPCSIGYAGRSSTLVPGPNVSGGVFSMTANNAALKILGVPPAQSCIQGFTYKYSRKLYLNSIQGFPTAQANSAPEFALAQCESDPGAINVVTTNGFVPLPDAGPNNVNNGKPFCEDFNEGLKCLGDAGNNRNACADNDQIDAGGLAPIPGAAVSTICGNGIVEAFEDCDLGNGNGAPPATCSIDCRNNF